MAAGLVSPIVGVGSGEDDAGVDEQHYLRPNPSASIVSTSLLSCPGVDETERASLWSVDLCSQLVDEFRRLHMAKFCLVIEPLGDLLD